MKGHHHSWTSRTGRADRMALMRLVAALAVMLLAVLPHATLAASAFHHGHAARSPSVAASHDGHGMHHGQAQAPCHEGDDQAGKAGPSMPSCCILGCGLLGSGSAIGSESLTARWLILSPAQVLAVAEAAPEPAERPPR